VIATTQQRESPLDIDPIVKSLQLEGEFENCIPYIAPFEETDLQLICMPHGGKPLLFFNDGFQQPTAARARAVAIMLVCYACYMRLLVKPVKSLEVSVQYGQIVYCELQLDNLAKEALRAMGVALPEYTPPEPTESGTEASTATCTALATTA
jgi:hypothetical protein